MKYWVYINNQILGPYEKEQFSQIQGFTPESMVCPENPPDGKQEWQPASTVLNSAQAAPAAVPAAPAPGMPLASQPAQPETKSNVEPLSLGQFGAPLQAAAPAPVQDSAANAAVAGLELTVKSQAEEIRSLTRKLDEFASSVQSLKAELDIMRSVPPAPQAAPEMPSSPMYSPAAQPSVDSGAAAFPGMVPDASVPVAEPAASSVEVRQPAPSAHEAAQPASAAQLEQAEPKVEKKNSKKVVVVLLVAIAAAGAYFAYSAGLIGGKPAPAPEPAAPAPAPVVAVSTPTVPAPQTAFNDEMLKLVKAYEVVPGSKTLEGVIAASAPEISVSSIEWSIQSLDPSLYSIAVKVPPSKPDAWQISYRFDYNVVEKRLSPANTEATELLDKAKAEAAAAAAPPPPPPQPKPKKKAAPKPKPVEAQAKPQNESVEVIEVVEQ
ncbi:MAG: hypothetical protein GX410_11500 [Elusimicrobia bacterium]|nr:hypothetical protein [Elusimicrobiota bacterium]